ncbi:hypothetical protein [Gordonibacter pamelaeae]|uniref:hypothetical protein n=1 Tax=Gordonibacter pamelaeae TaxID=471189 RepID=UPI003A91788A
MRLYERMYEPFTRLAPIRTPDGEGGSDTRWEPSDAVMCRMALAGGGEGVDAASRAAETPFKAISDKPVMYGDVLRRDSDGSTFRCVSSGADGHTPPAASFAFWRWAAERWEVPDADQG